MVGRWVTVRGSSSSGGGGGSSSGGGGDCGMHTVCMPQSLEEREEAAYASLHCTSGLLKFVLWLLGRHPPAKLTPQQNSSNKTHQTPINAQNHTPSTPLVNHSQRCAAQRRTAPHSAAQSRTEPHRAAQRYTGPHSSSRKRHRSAHRHHSRKAHLRIPASTSAAAC